MAWTLVTLGTVFALIALWLYGNNHKRAPMFGLLACLCWVIYDVLYDQWPLLLPTAMNIAVTLRNWKVMKST